MIRPYRPSDCEAVLEIWEAAATQAHPFLSPAFQAQERENIRTTHLPAAETWVWEDAGRVVGFLSLVDAEVGGLFVDPRYQGRGIGRGLLDRVRAERGSLTVEVFQANTKAKAFYLAYGFRPVEEVIHPPTGLAALRMALPPR